MVSCTPETTTMIFLQALGHTSLAAAEAKSMYQSEALMDNIRKTSAALSTYRAKLELMQLPEYKRQVGAHVRGDFGSFFCDLAHSWSDFDSFLG